MPAHVPPTAPARTRHRARSVGAALAVLLGAALASALPPRAARASGDATARRAPPAATATTNPCVGTWLGTGRNGTDPPWTIEMTVTAGDGAACGTIEYPSLGCGGVLRSCATRSGQSTFVEQYTHTSTRCAPDGTIVARCENGVMRWTWVGEEVVQTLLTRR